MVYITEQGEMWDHIARKIYGNERMMDGLIQQNPELAGVFRFDAGTEIHYTEKTPENTANVPIWRQAVQNGT